MKKLKLFALAAVALMGLSGVANASSVLLASDALLEFLSG
jgi:hypothetical protein